MTLLTDREVGVVQGLAAKYRHVYRACPYKDRNLFIHVGDSLEEEALVSKQRPPSYFQKGRKVLGACPRALAYF